jgi:uncharacterized protein YvpB
MKLYCYKQTTYETCLAVALLLLLKIKPTKSREIAVWKAGWAFNFLTGQINYIYKKHHHKLDVYIENKKYLKDIKPHFLPGISVTNAKIDIHSIDAELSKGPVIIYIDNFFIQKIVHAPHFILLEKLSDKYYKFSDPWDGKVKTISKVSLQKAIAGLRKHLKFSPIMIALK